jgi:hypothetical protein
MAEMGDDIDVARARDALARAEGQEGSDAADARDRARARLRAAGESI